MIDSGASGKGTSAHPSWEAVSTIRAHPIRPRQVWSILLAVLAVAAVLGPAPASAQFTVAGRKVPPQESNFAGVRHASPRYGLVVQINHDARLASDLELGLVDDAYASLLKQHRTAAVPADSLPLVFVSDAKIARFEQGGRRRMFRWLEPELAKHSDIHLSPAAIFIADSATRDRDTLRSALARGLAFMFDQRFRQALDSMDRPIPDKDR
jgi:hypothetical protein